MKTADEIIEILEHCTQIRECEGCPQAEMHDKCTILTDALSLIKKLNRDAEKNEREIENLRFRLEKAKPKAVRDFTEALKRMAEKGYLIRGEHKIPASVLFEGYIDYFAKEWTEEPRNEMHSYE